MADITDQHDQGSPSALDEHTAGNGNAVGESRGIKRQRPSTADDDDDDDDKPGRERRKIEIKFITDKSRRHITFSKRKAGIMKKVSINCFIYATSRCRANPCSCFTKPLLISLYRHTNCLYSPAPKFSCSSSPRLVWSTLSQHPSFNLLSPRLKERT
jgi:SRF-type transcription factor (DNA-binding and dimerisation domain)